MENPALVGEDIVAPISTYCEDAAVNSTPAILGIGASDAATHFNFEVDSSQ
jgi:hypothetical protein